MTLTFHEPRTDSIINVSSPTFIAELDFSLEGTSMKKFNTERQETALFSETLYQMASTKQKKKEDYLLEMKQNHG